MLEFRIVDKVYIQWKRQIKEAAAIAKAAGVGTLILGHFSTRYDDFSLFQKEAKEVFASVLLAEDGKIFSFR